VTFTNAERSKASTLAENNRTRNLRARLFVLAGVIALAGASCVDRGGAFIVENKSEADLVVRVTGTMRSVTSSNVSYQPRRDELSVPPHARFAVAVVSFADAYDVQKIEVLTAECAILATFDHSSDVAFPQDGQVIVVQPDLSAQLVREFPETGTLAQPSDRCDV
jgi:hypothetical protein